MHLLYLFCDFYKNTCMHAALQMQQKISDFGANYHVAYQCAGVVVDILQKSRKKASSLAA